MFLYSTVSTLKPGRALDTGGSSGRQFGHTNGWDGGAMTVLVYRRCYIREAVNIHNFTELELVQDCSLSGRVETNHENSHLLLAP